MSPNIDDLYTMIRNLINSRGYYGYARIKTILFQEQDQWLNSLTTIVLQHNTDEKVPDQLYHYRNVILAQVSITTIEFIELLNQLITNQKLLIKKCPPVTISGQLSQDQTYGYISSDDTHLGVGWAANVYTFIDRQQQRSFPTTPNYGITAVDAPLFPGYKEVVKGWIGFDVERTSYSKGVFILLPNYDAKIEEVRLETENLTITISPKETVSQDVRAKLYLENFREQRIFQKDVEFNTNSTGVPINFMPEWVLISLLSKTTGQIIDFRRHHISWPSTPKGVVIDLHTQDIEQIIHRGESDTVEFKLNIGEKKDFLETIVAFSNSSGGLLILGVDDNGQIKGYKGNQDDIVKMIHDRCEPPITPHFEVHEIKDTSILVLRIDVGDDPPYLLKSNGIAYVRHGANDFPPTRTELDAMYTKEGYPGIIRYSQSGY